MPAASQDSLRLSRGVLAVLLRLNMIYGVIIAVLLVMSFVAADPLFHALGVRGDPGREQLVFGMRSIAVLGLLAVPLAHLVLSRLRSIVLTVDEGSPFVVENAERLRTIAWAVLGMELLHVVIGAVARWASTATQPLDIDWSFSATRWLAALLLFVLARVFEQGALMRADLEGTV
jgi:peptidoglycan biosynthesis protein MviN/MurJ (putative lipid II flippase)